MNAPDSRAGRGAVDDTVDSTVDNTGRDTFASMLDEVRAFHQKHRFADLGGEDMVYRVALMAEELGEISACVSKGRPKAELAEECADLLILLLGNAIAADFDLAQAFRDKMDAINQRGRRIVDGRVRVSNWAKGEKAASDSAAGAGDSADSADAGTGDADVADSAAADSAAGDAAADATAADATATKP
ncbi:MAG: nucleoside triphosphate pyrophosphohydrolase family protein [Gammaproteobacteria bacterium]|nr:nucleoside triphosphate pyrophosphohydrolase family protein [Gammaproteobacteria bacterium]